VPDHDSYYLGYGSCVVAVFPYRLDLANLTPVYRRLRRCEPADGASCCTLLKADDTIWVLTTTLIPMAAGCVPAHKPDWIFCTSAAAATDFTAAILRSEWPDQNHFATTT
jgi:hypothetical protein